MPRPKNKLTLKQQAFIDLWDGDVKSTSEKAGFSYQYGRELATKPYIVQHIRNRQAAELAPKIMTRQERQALWTELAGDTNEKTSDRLKATELLGRSEADFIDRLKVESEIVFNITTVDFGKLARPDERELIDITPEDDGSS